MRASQLAKQHGHKLAPTGETPRVPLGLVLLDRLFEIPARKKLQHLRKDAAYFVHRLSLLRLYWFFRNPIQPIRGSAFHSHSLPRPAARDHSAILDSNEGESRSISSSAPVTIVPKEDSAGHGGLKQKAILCWK